VSVLFGCKKASNDKQYIQRLNSFEVLLKWLSVIVPTWLPPIFFTTLATLKPGVVVGTQMSENPLAAVCVS
jgi:hypothetical protein